MNSFVGIVAAVVAGTVAASVGAGTILHMSYQRHDESLGKLKNLYVQLSVYLDGRKGENGNGHTGGSPVNRFPDKEAAEIEASLSLSEVSNVLELVRRRHKPFTTLRPTAVDAPLRYPRPGIGHF